MILTPFSIKLDLQKELMEQLEINEVFSFHIGNVKIGIDESTVVSWIIMAVITVIAIILTRNLKVEGEISRRQALLEICYEKLESFFAGVLDEKGMKYAPWLMSTAIFIGASNMIGLFGFKPPTKSLQVTLAMALTSIVIVEFVGIKEHGFFGRLKNLTKPVWIVTPINAMEILIKPLSLCVRLFGNIIGAFIIMELLKIVVPMVLPVAFSLYFDLFDGFLQAYIFVFLTALYIQEAIGEEDESPLKQKKGKTKKSSKKLLKNS